MTMNNDKGGEWGVNGKWSTLGHFIEEGLTFTSEVGRIDTRIDQFIIYAMRDYSISFSNTGKAHLFRSFDTGTTKCGRNIHVDCFIVFTELVIPEYRCKVCTNQKEW